MVLKIAILHDMLAKTMVLYTCVSTWLLAHKSRDLSQAEKEITVVTC